MNPDISEFSFGYTLTSELVRRFRVKGVGAPVFPSLLDEGRVGYDVAIPGIPLFLQFKLSHVMVRGSAFESKLLGLPYYRMHLRPRRHSLQHELLLRLEARGFEVYYAAPEFHTPAELNMAYDTNTAVDRSAFWRPGDIGPLPDDADHYVAFQQSCPVGYFCSDPREVSRIVGHELFENHLPLRARLQGHPPSRQYWNFLSDQLITTHREEYWPSSEFPDSITRGRDWDPQDRVTFLAQTLYGCSLLWVSAQ